MKHASYFYHAYHARIVTTQQRDDCTLALRQGACEECRCERDCTRSVTPVSASISDLLSRCACGMRFDATDSAAISLSRRRRHVAGSEQTSRPRRVRARLLSCAAVLHAPASCCFERDPHDEERSRWTERVRFADLAFSRGVGFRGDFADVERITGPEIVLEERVLVLAPVLSYIFVNAVRAPHPRGGVRIWRTVGYNCVNIGHLRPHEHCLRDLVVLRSRTSEIRHEFDFLWLNRACAKRLSARTPPLPLPTERSGIMMCLAV